jgi:type II secretory pathway pseudopilin PulG
MTNVEKVAAARGRHSGFIIDSAFVIRPLGRSWAKTSHSSFSVAGAFTVIELIVVVTIIFILAGLVLGTVGYARKKGARARAETEIAAMSAACESYKADNGVYPRDDTTNQYTDKLNARTQGDPGGTPCPSPCPDPAAPTTYSQTSLFLYTQLSGMNPDGTPIAGARSYFSFKPNMLSPRQSLPTTAIVDPFGNSYGYSTANQYDPNTPKGYNPTFDLWSTAGLTATPGGIPDTITPQWIKNW